MRFCAQAVVGNPWLKPYPPNVSRVSAKPLRGANYPISWILSQSRRVLWEPSSPRSLLVSDVKPRLLDLFCGAGGATKGYQRAGFHVTGVDIVAQPNYCGDDFYLADAMSYRLFGGWEAIHASPPCQKYTKARKLRGNSHSDLIGPLRDRLVTSGIPWVIENVPGAPLKNPALLCGTMFGLRVYRHRLFETSWPMPFMLHPAHHKAQVKMGRPCKEGDVIQPVGNFSGVEYARRAMEIPWMTQQEMREAIPPAYTEFVGRELWRLLVAIYW